MTVKDSQPTGKLCIRRKITSGQTLRPRAVLYVKGPESLFGFYKNSLLSLPAS